MSDLFHTEGCLWIQKSILCDRSSGKAPVPLWKGNGWEVVYAGCWRRIGVHEEQKGDRKEGSSMRDTYKPSSVPQSSVGHWEGVGQGDEVGKVGGLGKPGCRGRRLGFPMDVKGHSWRKGCWQMLGMGADSGGCCKLAIIR